MVEHLAYTTNEDVGWVVSNNKYDFPGGDLGYIFVPETVSCAEDFGSIQTYPPDDPKNITEDSGSSIVCITGMYIILGIKVRNLKIDFNTLLALSVRSKNEH